ncbi:hypothetical protein H4219_003210, partial [Mycoemilia scoparia]
LVHWGEKIKNFFGNKGRSGVNVRKSNYKKFTRNDHITYGLFFALIGFYAFREWYFVPNNMFKELRIGPDARCSQLRAAVDKYAQRKWYEDPSNPDPSAVIKVDNVENDPIVKKYDFLVDRFCKNPQEAKLYMDAGEDAYLNTITSPVYIDMVDDLLKSGKRKLTHKEEHRRFMPRTKSDWALISIFLYKLPAIIIDFSAAFLVLSYVTSSALRSPAAPGRGWYKFWAYSIIGVLVFFDILTVFSSGDSEVGVKAGFASILLFFVRPSLRTRRVRLIVAFLLFSTLDYLGSNNFSNEQLLKIALGSSRDANQSLKLANAIRKAALKHDKLRQSYIESLTKMYPAPSPAADEKLAE